MLSAKENMIQVLDGGKPDRFVNQYEALSLLFHPFLLSSPFCPKGTPMDKPIPNAWGIYNCYPEDNPGSFPVHDDEHVLVKDIENWQEYVTPPSLDFSNELWDQAIEMYNAVPEDKSIRALFVAPGLFEQCHHMCKVDEVLAAMYEYPDELHEMIKMLVDWELKLAEGFIDHMHPEAIFHHDDWGSQNSTFMSPAMFEEFYLEGYKQIYGYYHERGVKYVFHHSDSYAATLVPDMIEMGIDCWQGCFSTNNLSELCEKYGDKITFMGGIDNHFVDFEEWTEENNRKVVRETIEECSKPGKGFIPCIAQGGPGSVFPGVYQSIWDEIDNYNTEKFGWTKEQLDEARLPISIMF